MSVIYKVITRPTDPRVPNSPKRYYPHLITLGQSVNLKYIAQKMQDRSSLSVGDIKSVIQNFVEKMKEQLLEGKSINIEGLGVFMLTARSKGAELAKDINAKSVDSVRIFFQANKELRVTKTATRADEKLDLISLDEYLKKNIPQIKVYRPQASFLVWLDCRKLKLAQPELVQLFEDKAGLALNDGTMFGKEGEGFMRLNIGCPRSILNQALESLKKAIG